MSEPLLLRVEHGDGAAGCIPNPASYNDGGIVWRLTYTNDRRAKIVVVFVIETFDYLICGDIPMKEVVRRMRQFRDAYKKMRKYAEAQS